MEFPDLKIEWQARFFEELLRGDRSEKVVGGLSHIDIQAYMIIAALFLISFTWRWYGKKTDKATMRLEDINRTMDEFTDSTLETRREMREQNKNLEILNRNIEKLIDAVNSKL